MIFSLADEAWASRNFLHQFEINLVSPLLVRRVRRHSAGEDTHRKQGMSLTVDYRSLI